MTQSNDSELRRLLQKYLGLRSDRITDEEVNANIRADASFRGARLWVLIFAIFVASLGLNVNSTAVIIGAMLISPLMGPIVGMGFAVGTSDLDLLRSSAKNFGIATLASVLTAALYFLLSPYKEAQSELLARTAPTLYDVLIAFFGGAAGIVAIAAGGKGNVVTGVAIATALMPPLCTAGYGIATGQWLFFLGAFYLFFINTVFISLATFIGVRLMGFAQHRELTPQRSRKVNRILIAVVVLTMVPATAMTLNLIHQSLFKQNLAHYADNELSWSGTQILTSHADADTKVLRVAILGREVSDAEIVTAQARLANYGLADYHLSLVQGTYGDSLMALVGQLETSKSNYKQTSLQQALQLKELQNSLESYERLERLAAELRPELQVLYPQIEAITLARSMEQRTDTALATPIVVAIIDTHSSLRLTDEETSRLAEWLQARTAADTLRVVTGR